MLILILLMLITAMVIHAFYTVVYSIYYKAKINSMLDSINTKDDLLYMKHRDFVNVIAEAFKRKGCKVKLTDKCGEEQNGLILNDIQYVEVCKHSVYNMLHVEPAMKLARCMYMNSIYKGMFITLGDFKQNTKAFCFKNVIECINGDKLLDICKEVQKREPAYEQYHQHASGDSS